MEAVWLLPKLKLRIIKKKTKRFRKLRDHNKNQFFPANLINTELSFCVTVGIFKQAKPVSKPHC